MTEIYLNMETSVLDNLNEILTNTLEYKETIQEFSSRVAGTAVETELNKMVEQNKDESEKLILLISDLDGKVMSTERKTDQAMLSWLPNPIPNAQDKASIISLIIAAEQEKIEAYNTMKNFEDFDQNKKANATNAIERCENNIKSLKSGLKS
jgi:hypothetical protein